MLSSSSPVVACLARLSHPTRCPLSPRRLPALSHKCGATKVTTPAPVVRTHVQADLTTIGPKLPRHVTYSSASGAGSSDQGEVSQVVLRGYQLVGLLSLSRVLLFAVFAPKTIEQVVGVSMSQTTELLVRTLGVLEIIPVALLFYVQAAVANGQVNSNATKRFAWCLFLSEIAMYFMKFAMRSTLGLAQPELTAGLIFPLSQLALYYTAYSAIPVMSIFDGIVIGVKNTFKKQSWMAAYYSFLAVSAIIGVGVHFAAPGRFFGPYILGEMGELGTAAIRLWSPFLLLMGVSSYTLREAVEDGTMGTTMPKVLNLTILAILCVFVGMACFMFKSIFTNKGLAILGIDVLFAAPIVYNLFVDTD